MTPGAAPEARETSLVAVEPASLPPPLRTVLVPHERVYFAAQPRRPALGRGVWFIGALGLLFAGTSLSAGADVLARMEQRMPEGALGALGVGCTVGFAGVFVCFALMLLALPWVLRRRLRQTWVLITQERVLSVRIGSDQVPRTQGSWPLHECRDLAVTRRRGDTATLVLREGLRERATDGQTVYHWDALHGIPRADEALRVLQRLAA